MDPLQYLMSANQPTQSPSMLDQMMTGHPSPVNAPYQQGDFQRSGPQMQRSTPLDALMSTFAPQRDEQGIPKPMGAADIINAGLWVLPGMGGRRPISPAAPRIESPIRAYHGSPHDFDKFDISKIGTGEGAQAYGHGLYFAENEGVAKSYRDALTARNLKDFGSVLADSMLTRFKGDRDAAISDLRNTERIKIERPDQFEQLKAENDAAIRLLENPSWSGGKMYEVNINANPEHLLDWDKPLSGPAGELAQDAIFGRTAFGNRRFRNLPDEQRAEAARLYARDAEGAAKLRDAGIPGIKYLDQGSRVTPATVAEQRTVVENARARLPQIERSNLGNQALNNARANLASEEQRLASLEARAANPSSNYVVFNDKLIDIMRKYGLAGAGPLGALMAGGNDQQAPQ